ncbi:MULTISPECIES: hypothetical protein [Clostridium]|uniref:hypothetical protein n=1 Tax=Clostridium TaxID=1485 RepID=UPI001EF3062C|nr:MULTISPECIES: hypothetical protein [Clostridium]
MDKEHFKETENRIYSYYKKDKLIKSLNTRLKILNNQIDKIREDLKSCNVSIEPNIKVISYEEHVQSSCKCTSYAEREIVKVTEYKIERLNDKEFEKEKVLEQIDQIELDYRFIGDAIELIKGEAQQLLELKYKKGYSEQKIGYILHLTQSQINKKKWKLIGLIADFDHWGRVI